MSRKGEGNVFKNYTEKFFKIRQAIKINHFFSMSAARKVRFWQEKLCST